MDDPLDNIAERMRTRQGRAEILAELAVSRVEMETDMAERRARRALEEIFEPVVPTTAPARERTPQRPVERPMNAVEIAALARQCATDAAAAAVRAERAGLVDALGKIVAHLKTDIANLGCAQAEIAELRRQIEALQQQQQKADAGEKPPLRLLETG